MKAPTHAWVLPGAWLPLLLALSLLGACAPQTMYHWGKYERSLYSYYKHPDEIVRFEEALAGVITKGESLGKVPPGLYAEYGYILMQLGEDGQAVAYFEKEKLTWPESSGFMDRMIVAVRDQSSGGAQ
jgi:hypothetical protein